MDKYKDKYDNIVSQLFELVQKKRELDKAEKEIGEAPLYLGGFGAMSISSIEKNIRDLVLRHNLKVVIINSHHHFTRKEYCHLH